MRRHHKRHAARHARHAHRFHRDPGKKTKRKSPFLRFMAARSKEGMSRKQALKAWKSHKKSYMSKSKPIGHRTLPKELVLLAAALRAASSKPTADKATAIEKKVEDAIRSLRRAQKDAAAEAAKAQEDMEIMEEARKFVHRDPGRKRSRKGRKTSKKRSRRSRR